MGRGHPRILRRRKAALTTGHDENTGVDLALSETSAEQTIDEHIEPKSSSLFRPVQSFEKSEDIVLGVVGMLVARWLGDIDLSIRFDLWIGECL